MRVEDIEVTIKELIKEAYSSFNDRFEDVVDSERLENAIKQVSHRSANTPPKTFNELTLAEYINLLTLQDSWEFFRPIFNLPTDSVKNLLHSVRETRNLLAHFRGDLSAEQRDRLKFSIDWLSRCHEEYQEVKEKRKMNLIFERSNSKTAKDTIIQQKEPEVFNGGSFSSISATDFMVTDAAKSGSRYAALADWLQSQPGRFDQIPLTFNEVEEIIGSDLPESARTFRAWWANDSVGHSHSQLWLDAGWRTTYINLSEGRVTFSRIREREKAYIDFFSKLLDEMHKKAPNIKIKNQSPDGTSWLVLQTIPRGKAGMGSFVCSFTRDRRFRIELYLDLRDKDTTKSVFNKLYEQKARLEDTLGQIEWEKLETKRASRVAIYRDGYIVEADKHDELRAWAVDTFSKFYPAFLKPAEDAILEVWNG